ncbi:MAG TPA: hypothetical protein VN755_03205, partial [Steroidobacteraceae bacterium]|nr:hypothetical protein [Steroidobacteraceae bacterium]
MELLIALIPALPLVGFLFAVLLGPRLDRVPAHGHDDHGTDSHGADDHATADAHDAHADGADEDLQPIPTEEEQR